MGIGDDLRFTELDLLALYGRSQGNLELSARQKLLKDQRIEGLEREVEEFKKYIQELTTQILALQADLEIARAQSDGHRANLDIALSELAAEGPKVVKSKRK